MKREDKLGVIGRLIEEVSWEGKKIKMYRDGGPGLEVILAAEVFQGLDFLPRTEFLGTIIKSLKTHGDITKVRHAILNDIEEAQFTFKPGNIYLRPSADSHQSGIAVQPDGILQSENFYCIVEAKRIKRNYIRPIQLAREFVITTREAKGRLPLFLLVLGEEPPVRITGKGRKEIKEAIMDELEDTLKIVEGYEYSVEEIENMIHNSVAWITWDDIYEIVKHKSENLNKNLNSIKSSILRLSNSILNSIERHR